jgi:hypothetical protein
VAPDTRDQGCGSWRFQNASLKHPRTVRQWMLRFDLAALNGQAEGSGAGAEQMSGFGQIHPSL